MPTTYPIGVGKLQNFALADAACVASVFRFQVQAVRAGPVRRVRRGEWFLHGPANEAFFAPNGLIIPKPIARLVTLRGRRVACQL